MSFLKMFDRCSHGCISLMEPTPITLGSGEEYGNVYDVSTLTAARYGQDTPFGKAEAAPVRMSISPDKRKTYIYPSAPSTPPRNSQSSGAQTREERAEKKRLRDIVSEFVRRATCGLSYIMVDAEHGDRKNVMARLEKNMTELVITPIGGQQERKKALVLSLSTCPEVLCFEDRCDWSPAIMALSAEEKDCLVVLDGGASCLLEESKSARDRLIACIKILSLYVATEQAHPANTIESFEKNR